MSLDTILGTLSEKAAAASPLGSTLKFDFGEKQVFVDGTGDTNVVSDANNDADCTINVSMDDFNALLKQELNPMAAFMSGKIKVKGDMGIAMKLQSLLA